MLTPEQQTLYDNTDIAVVKVKTDVYNIQTTVQKIDHPYIKDRVREYLATVYTTLEEVQQLLKTGQ